MSESVTYCTSTPPLSRGVNDKLSWYLGLVYASECQITVFGRIILLCIYDLIRPSENIGPSAVAAFTGDCSKHWSIIPSRCVPWDSRCRAFLFPALIYLLFSACCDMRPFLRARYALQRVTLAAEGFARTKQLSHYSLLTVQS